jgi:hypothetical protein
MSTLVGRVPSTSTLSRQRIADDRAAGTLGAGGVLFAIGNLLHPLEHSDAAYQASTWTAAHLVIFASLPLILLGLPRLTDLLRARGAGLLAPLVQVLTMVGTLGIAPGLLIEAFVAPEIGFAAVSRLEAGGSGMLASVLGVAWIASVVLLAAACRRARFGPTPVHPLLVLAAVALLVGAGPGPIGGAIIIASTATYGGAVAWLGWSLRHA